MWSLNGENYALIVMGAEPQWFAASHAVIAAEPAGVLAGSVKRREKLPAGPAIELETCVGLPFSTT